MQVMFFSVAWYKLSHGLVPVHETAGDHCHTLCVVSSESTEREQHVMSFSVFPLNEEQLAI